MKKVQACKLWVAIQILSHEQLANKLRKTNELYINSLRATHK
jgi:hypothetical protein